MRAAPVVGMVVGLKGLSESTPMLIEKVDTKSNKVDTVWQDGQGNVKRDSFHADLLEKVKE